MVTAVRGTSVPLITVWLVTVLSIPHTLDLTHVLAGLDSLVHFAISVTRLPTV